MKIRQIKLLDMLIGYLCVHFLPVPFRNNTLSEIMSVLLIRPGGIGDAVHLAPFIRSLKKSYPAIHITVLAEQRNVGAFSLILGLGRLLCYDRPLELLRTMRGSYDMVIDTEQSHHLSAVVARLMRAPIKIGFDTNERRRMFTHPVSYSHDDYETISFNRLLEPLGIKAGMLDSRAPFLSVPEDASGRAEALLEAFHNEPFVVVFPGASIPERRWGADRFRRVAELLSVFGIKVVVVGGKEDRQQGNVIVSGGLGLNLAGVTSLAETAAVIQKSSLLVSGDSGVLHIAVGLCVPTVSLFGPGRAEKWAPQGNHHVVINKKLPCSPCTTFGTTPPCPIDVRCMRDITVDEVVNSVTMLLTSLGTLASRCCKRDWIETE